MSDNNDNKYQDQFQVPSGVNMSNGGSEGYNDTYYDQSYKDNKYNEYEEPKKSFPWKLVIIIVLALLFVFLFWYFLFGRGSTANTNIQYEKLSDELCEKAKEYVGKKDGYIDTATPGATAYVSLQDLVDDYAIPSEPIRDPRYKKSLFKKTEGSEYLSFNSYLRLFVMANGQVSCEGLVDTGEDHTKPILTLKGTTPVKIAKGTNFQDPGAKAVDDVDGDISDKIARSGNVDTLVVGEYKITYSVSDTSGNTTTIERLIVVEEYEEIEVTLGSNLDLITPQIELKGTNPYCVIVGQKYKEPGAIATDNIDGNITNRIKVDSSAVTGERTGNFRVTYEVSDTYGHKAIAYRSVMVRTTCPDLTAVETTVNSRPQIQLIGGTAITINIYEDYKDRGATAWDKEDGSLPVVLISNTVNTSRAGIYEVVYKATDSGGLSTTAKRIVTVKDPSAISNTASFSEVPAHMRIPLGSVQTIPVPTAKDSYGNALQVTVTIKDSSEAVVSAINFYRVETYRVEYFAKPANGVGQTVHRNVTIYDDVAPTITIADKVYIPVRTANCDLTIVDLKASGMVVSDAPNEVAPNVILTGGENKMCTLNSTGADIEVYAQDASGNKSPVRKIKLYVLDNQGGQDPTSVEIGNCGTNGELSIFIGDQAILNAQVFPTNANDMRVTWASALPQYATIDENGKLLGIAKGSTKITVTTVKGGKTDTCNIVVKERQEYIPVTGVDIAGCESGTMTMTVGTSKTLSAVVKPTNATNKSVSWDFGTFEPAAILIPKCTNSVKELRTEDIVSNCLANSKPTGDWVSMCVEITPKCIGGSPVIAANKVGQHTISVTTADGNKTKSCVVKVVEKGQDTTAPSKVIVKSNTANANDPYNKNGSWYGGTLGRTITITVESTDPESKIARFEAGYPTTLREYNLDGQVIGTINKIFTITPEVSQPNIGKLVISEDMAKEISFIAINESGLVSELSDPVIVKLDNSGPTTNFTAWIEDANKWVSQNQVTIKYESLDMVAIGPTIKGLIAGSGVKEYQYTHDDVKAKEAKDIKIEGITNNIQMIFPESNLNKYVYVRAVDNLGNIGPWTAKPSWLNMDTVPPAPTTLSFLENSNNTSNVKILFKFTDNSSPKMSGFGKYEYTLNAGAAIVKTTESEPLILTTPGTYSLSAWSFDKAGNKSASPGTLGGIKVTNPPKPTPTPPSQPSTDCSGAGMSIALSGVTSAKVGDTVSLVVTTGGNVSACGFTISCGKGIGTTASYTNGMCQYKITSYPDVASEGAVGTTNVSAAILDKSGNVVKNNGSNVIDYHRITVANPTPTPQCVNKYRYIMTNNYTGSNAHSDWIYVSTSAAKSACEGTPKYKETIPKAVCTTTTKTVNYTQYRYRGYDDDMLPHVSNYIYASSTNAINACKSTYRDCSAESKVNTKTEYLYILTEAFTNKKTTSTTSYTSLTNAMSACTSQYSTLVNNRVSVVTCSADTTPKCVY